MKPMSGAMIRAGQKNPMLVKVVKAITVPTIKKSPWAKLMMSRRPKIIDKPRAISATISPKTMPFIARAIMV